MIPLRQPRKWQSPVRWVLEQRDAFDGPNPLINLGFIDLIWTDPPVRYKNDQSLAEIEEIWTPHLLRDGLIIFNPKNDQVDWYNWVESQVLEHSKVGSLIVDPFCGESTTGIVAIRNGRFYYGCDIDERALDISREKLQSANA